MTVELTSMTGVARLWSQKQNHGQLEDVCEMVVPLGHRRLAGVCSSVCTRRGLEGDLRTHSGARNPSMSKV